MTRPEQGKPSASHLSLSKIQFNIEEASSHVSSKFLITCKILKGPISDIQKLFEGYPFSNKI